MATLIWCGRAQNYLGHYHLTVVHEGVNDYNQGGEKTIWATKKRQFSLSDTWTRGNMISCHKFHRMTVLVHPLT